VKTRSVKTAIIMGTHKGAEVTRKRRTQQKIGGNVHNSGGLRGRRRAPKKMPSFNSSGTNNNGERKKGGIGGKADAGSEV